MPLNPKAAEFQPQTWMSTRHGSGEKPSKGGYASYPVSIPLPDDPFAQEYDDVRDNACTCELRSHLRQSRRLGGRDSCVILDWVGGIHM